MTVNKDFPNLPEEKLLSNVFQLQSSDSCVVLVGTTGTGKTTCLSGESAVGVTKEISCVADLHHQEGQTTFNVTFSLTINRSLSIKQRVTDD